MKKNKLTNSYLLGGNLRNKAFTLIELLAIIVILAIIAVITVPIILNVIDNAKKGSIIDSAYGYKDAVDKYYITKLMEEDFELNDTYSVSEGKLGGIDIPISGMKPISGTLTYENNELKSGCLTFDDYKVSYDGSKFTNENGKCPTQRAITYTDSNGVKYYNTEWIGTNPVYYNPVTGESCTDYHEDNSKTGYNGVSPEDNQTSCLKWYAYSEQSSNVNLLLDHNTTATVVWSSSGSNASGPTTLLEKLKDDTTEWSDKLKRNDKYVAKTENQSVDYSEYNARLITAQEIAYIAGNTVWDEKSTSSSSFFFDSQTSTASLTCKTDNTLGCSYGWLYDRTRNNCTQKGCLHNSDVEIHGYWTVSPYASNSINAWDVSYYSYFNVHYVNNNGGIGLRPVITIPKSSIFES